MRNYTPIHLHTEISNLFTQIDSASNYQDYIDKAVKSGMKAIAFTEHGNIVGWIDKYHACKKAGIKYIHGVEAYVTKSLDEKVRDNMHVIMLAKNIKGIYEINRLMSHKVACNRKDGKHFYYNPRISLDELFNISDNIIITTACVLGLLGNKADDETQDKFINWLANRNKGLAYFEIQHHTFENQLIHNKKMVSLSEKYDIPLVVGTDTHSSSYEKAEAVIELQVAKNIGYDDDEGRADLVFKNYQELLECYKKQRLLRKDIVLEAIENTNVIADSIEEYELDYSIKYPKMYDDGLKVLKSRIKEGLQFRKPYIEEIPRDVIKNRINEELDVIKKIGAVDFILLEDYVKKNARENGKYCGYSRGSCSGSFICYLLGITEVNSIRFGMSFFRFMNPSRVSLCDIDSDWFEDDKDWVQGFLLENENFNSCHIITFNTIAYKGTIRELGRSHKEVPKHIVDEIAKIDYEKERDKLDKYKEEYPDFFKSLESLLGTIVSFGSHPAGILVSDRDIASELGTITLNTNEHPVCACNMVEVDSLNWVKLDVLGLTSIGVVNKACESIGIDRLTPDNMDLNDEKVWMSIAKDNRTIFQWESDLAKKILENMFNEETLEKIKKDNSNFSYLKWFSFGNGLLRPSCASFRDKASIGEGYDNGLKEINEFLSSTLGYVTFQEQIMKFLVNFCGYSEAESDNVRRSIAKKKGTDKLIPEIRERFVEFSHKKFNISKDMLEEMIKPFLQVIQDASDYGFSENHSDPYSMIGYAQGYLRYYYPVHYLASSLNCFSENKHKEKRKHTTEMAKEMKVEIRPARFRYSSAEYLADVDNRRIYKGIGSISYLNNTVGEELYSLRDKKFDNFIELLNTLDTLSINKRQRDILIKLDFFEEFGMSYKLLKTAEIYDKIASRKQFKKAELSTMGLNEGVLRKYANKETEKIFKEVDVISLVDYMCSNIKDKQINLFDRLETQNEYLGYIEYVNEELINYGFVVDVNLKNKPKILVYRIDTGEYKSYKIDKRKWSSRITNNTIIVIKEDEDRFGYSPCGEYFCEKTQQMKTKFEIDKNKIDPHINEYEIIDRNN